MKFWLGTIFLVLVGFVGHFVLKSCPTRQTRAYKDWSKPVNNRHEDIWASFKYQFLLKPSSLTFGSRMAEPMYVNITADPENVTEIESLCMNCHENGITCIFMAKIPFFKEMILTSFRCEHCGYRNNEVQSGGKEGFIFIHKILFFHQKTNKSRHQGCADN